MEPNNEGIRDRLLSRLPQPAGLAEYRREVASLLEKNEKGLRRDKLGTGALWFFMVGLSTLLVLLGGRLLDTPKATTGAFLASMACFCMIFGAVELLKHFINRTRVELLKETKQVQLQVLELHEWLRKQRD